MEKINWGVLGAANIAVNKVIPSFKNCGYSSLQGIASRDINKAKKIANEMKISKAYGSYEELLADSDIQAIYIPLPNHLHIPWSEKALKAGKHVLCEKPIAMDATEAKKFLEFSKDFPNQKIMEAFMYKHHPQWVKVLEMVRGGKIGEVKTIHSVFTYFLMDPENCRNRIEMGGGGLMDIGCYPINLSRMLFDKEPERVMGVIEKDQNFKTDRHTLALMDFGTGTASFSCSTQMSPYQRANIIGSEGRIEIQIPFNQPEDKPARILYFNGKKEKQISFSAADQYSIQLDLFSKAILNDSPVPVPLEDAVCNMNVIDAIFKSADTGQWEKL